MNLNIRQLQAFREVMRTGSISEAARELNRTQPAVSAMISSLEGELGLTLFERQHGRLIKKPEAQYFFGEVDAIMARLTQTANTMKDLANLQEGRLRISCMAAAASYILPRLVANFVRDKPRVKVSLIMRSSDTIEELVASQQYDIGLTETPPPNRALTIKTFKLRCVCMLRPDDPLADKSTISPSDLSGHPLATLYDGNPNQIATREAFRKFNAEFYPRFEVRSFHSALKIVEEGLCYCICDPMTASSYIDSHGKHSALVCRPFAPEIPLSISILQPAHRPASVLAAAFTEALHDELIRVGKLF